MKNIARSALVTLPRFVQDQDKYKATLRQIGRLNGILPRAHHATVGPNNHRANITPGPTAATRNKRRTTARRTKPHTQTTPPQRGGLLIQYEAPTPAPPSPPISTASNTAHETDFRGVGDGRLTEEEAVPTALISPLANGFLGTADELTGDCSVASDRGAGISAKRNTVRGRAADKTEGHEESSGHNGHGGETLPVAPTLIVDGTSSLRAAVDSSRPHTSPMVVANRACHGGIRSARDTGGRYCSFPCEVLNRPPGNFADMTALRPQNNAGGLLAGSHGWPLCSSGGHRFGNNHTLEGDGLLAPGSGGLVHGTLPHLITRTH